MYVIPVATELSLTGFNVKWLKIGGELGHTHFLRGPTYESLPPPHPPRALTRLDLPVGQRAYAFMQQTPVIVCLDLLLYYRVRHVFRTAYTPSSRIADLAGNAC